MTNGNTVWAFTGVYSFLSNFADSVVYIPAEGKELPYKSLSKGRREYKKGKALKCLTVEHAFHAMKTVYPKERRKIATETSPGKAKRAGRKALLRANWDEMRIDIMRCLVLQKFQHKKLFNLLDKTKDCKLVEGNTWGDRFWGQVDCQGENNLGKILIQVRTELRKKKDKNNAL